MCIGFTFKANSPISPRTSGYSSYQPLDSIDEIKAHIKEFSHLCCMNLFVPDKGLIDFTTMITSHYDTTEQIDRDEGTERDETAKVDLH